MRDQRRCWIDPQVRPRIAAFGRTAQFISAIAQAADFHLAAVKFSLAENAKPLVVERGPVSKSISSTKHLAPVGEYVIGDHNSKTSLLIASMHAIARLSLS